MQVSVTARKIEMTPALKSYAEQKVLKITKHLERVIDAHIVLSVEKYRHKAEVAINANGFIIRGEEVTEDMYSAIDQVMDKLDAQIKKYKSKSDRRARRRLVEQPTIEMEDVSEEELDFEEVGEEDWQVDGEHTI